MSRYFALLLVGVCFFVSSARSEPPPDKKLQDAMQGLTAEQKQWLEDFLKIPPREVSGIFAPFNLSTSEVRALTVRNLAQPPERRKEFLQQVQERVLAYYRDEDPFYLSPADKAAMSKLPAAARTDAAELAHEDLEKSLAAQRKMLAHGPECRGLVVEQLRKAAKGSPRYLGLIGFLYQLEALEKHEAHVRRLDQARAKIVQVKKKLDASKSKAAVHLLVSPSLFEYQFGENDPLVRRLRINFLKGNRDWDAGVGLIFDDSDPDQSFHINKFEGQDNRIKEVQGDFAKITAIPKAEVTAQWWKKSLELAVGPIYLLHMHHPDHKVDFGVKFQVLEMRRGEWAVILWERIPQEK